MKKLIAILLALVMVLSLAACAAKQPAAETEKPAEQQESAEKPAEEKKPAEPEEPAEPVTLTIGLVQKANVESYEDNEFTAWLEEQTGYNLEFVYFSSDHAEAITQLTAMMAGGEKLPDIIWGINGVEQLRNEWGNDGYLIDLAPYLEDKEASATFWSRMDECLTPAMQKNIMNKAKDQSTGAYYALPSYQVSGTDKQATQVYINQTWLDNLGLAMPTSFDELVDVLVAFRDNDPNGNGVADELPMVGGVGLYRADIVEWLINNWIFCNDANIDGCYFFNVDENNKLYYPQITEEYREALRNINKLVDDNLLSTLSWTVSQTSELKAIVNPEDGTAIAGVIGCHFSVHTLKDSELMYQYVPLAPFNYAPMEEDNYRLSACITEDCENPDAAFALLDFMTCEEAAIRMKYGVPEVDWTYDTDDNGIKGILVLNADAYSGQTRQTWSFLDAAITNFQVSPNATIRAAGTEPGWTDIRKATMNEHLKLYSEAAEKNNPAEVVYIPYYNAEELEMIGDIDTNLETYFKNCRAEFCNGTMNLDTDWDKYVSDFQAIGADTLLACAQSAFDRAE
ncbi:MAG: extracellular solute-binding protein [Clostridia bacterium]|nr:extracellular solute-binding protein [Clostridia bacterium]